MPQKDGGGGFSGLNAKPDTDGQPYLTIPYISQGFQIYDFGLDVMNNPPQIISNDTGAQADITYQAAKRGYYALVSLLYTDKKEKKIVLIYKEVQNGAVAKSYMMTGFLIYEEMRK